MWLFCLYSTPWFSVGRLFAFSHGLLVDYSVSAFYAFLAGCLCLVSDIVTVSHFYLYQAVFLFLLELSIFSSTKIAVFTGGVCNQPLPGRSVVQALFTVNVMMKRKKWDPFGPCFGWRGSSKTQTYSYY